MCSIQAKNMKSGNRIVLEWFLLVFLPLNGFVWILLKFTICFILLTTLFCAMRWESSKLSDIGTEREDEDSLLVPSEVGGEPAKTTGRLIQEDSTPAYNMEEKREILKGKRTDKISQQALVGDENPRETSCHVRNKLSLITMCNDVSMIALSRRPLRAVRIYLTTFCFVSRGTH